MQPEYEKSKAARRSVWASDNHPCLDAHSGIFRGYEQAPIPVRAAGWAGGNRAHAAASEIVMSTHVSPKDRKPILPSAIGMRELRTPRVD
jgi:hypothetical protein